MNYLGYITMDMEIWFLTKPDIVEKFWIYYPQWSELKALGESWEPNHVPEWFLLFDSLAYKWNLYHSLGNDFEEYYQNLRSLLKKPRTQLVLEVDNAVREAIKNNYFTVSDEVIA